MKKEYLEILLEDINKKIDLVVEGHQVLDKKIDDRFNELDKKINDNRDLMRAMNKDLNTKIEQTAQNLDTKIERLDKKMGKINRVVAN